MGEPRHDEIHVGGGTQRALCAPRPWVTEWCDA